MTTKRKARNAFTLIELLAVIAIIAILSGLTLAAVGRFRDTANRTIAASEISQLSNAIAAFKTKYNVPYIPDGSFNNGAGFRFQTSYATTDPEVAYLRLLWPNIDLASTGLGANKTATDGNLCLVYFLAGPDGTGYSKNRQRPFNPSVSGVDRDGPYFEFKQNRFNGAGQYCDPWGNPYAYFSPATPNGYTQNPAHAFRGFMPCYTLRSGTRMHEQLRGFQIVSAGKNGAFGLGGDYTGANLADYVGGGAGADDMSSFTQTASMKQD